MTDPAIRQDDRGIARQTQCGNNLKNSNAATRENTVELGIKESLSQRGLDAGILAG